MQLGRNQVYTITERMNAELLTAILIPDNLYI
jgi:hypothetical protein